MSSKIAAALLDAVTTAVLDAALAGKADASALAALQSTVDGLDMRLEVDSKIANALLGLATEAFVAAQLASRDASISALQGAKADTSLLASYATNEGAGPDLQAAQVQRARRLLRPKAPKCGTEKSRHAVLQTFCAAVPSKVNTGNVV